MGSATKWWAMGSWGVLVMACGSPEGETRYVMHQYYEYDSADGFGPYTGCTQAVYPGEEEGSSTLAGGLPGLEGDFVLKDHTVGEGLEVTVLSQDEVLATRDYDVAFVRSGSVDSFEVTTHAGRVFGLAYWGGPRCDTSRVVLGAADAADPGQAPASEE